MKVGTVVMLVGTDGFMPPLAAQGMVVGPLDDMGDHEVLFPDHPCPVGDEITWFVPEKWLMPLDDGFARRVEEAQLPLSPSLLRH